MPGILNAVTNAAAGLATVASIGQNATLAAPSIGIAGVGVPGIPLISFRDYFLTTMESWVTSIPTRTQFIAIIDKIPKGMTSSLLQQLEGNKDGSKKDFDIDKAKSALGAYALQDVVGCIFLVGASIPSENLTADSAKIDNNRGFIQGSILQGRDAFASNNLTLQFRETNSSFTDLIMRPWLITASHAGYVARDTSDPLYCKCNITILQYSRTFQGLSMIPRKVWTYYNCVPLNLSTRNLSYDAESIENYDVSFIYDDYGVQNTLYLPLPDIISKISHGHIPRVSPFQK
jgi:hypothetical protein